MPASTTNHEAYRKVDVETASQGKLIVMLFNGAIQRAEEAKRQMQKRNTASAHNNLIRAQDIIAELRGALNMQAGEIARNLDRIYEYFQHSLIQANVRKDCDLIDHCIEMMSAMRTTWEETFQNLAKEAPVKHPPTLNQHGAAVFNVQG